MTMPPTPEQQLQIVAELAKALEAAKIATRNLLFAVALLGVANATLIVVILAQRR